MKRLVLGLVLFVMTVSLPATSHAATNDLTLTTSPLPIHLTANPGQTITTELRVKNSGPKAEHLKLGLMKFGAQGEAGRPDLAERGPTDAYFDWVSFAPSNFVAPPNQWMDVRMTIKVPKTASLGYYYAVTFQRAVPTQTEHQTTSVIGATATLVLLEVPSPNEKRVLLVDQLISQHKVYQYLPAEFTVRLHNTGNIHLSPTGNLFIKKGKNVIATLPFNQYQGSVLPNSYREFAMNWSDGFPKYVDKVQNGKPVLTAKGQPDRTLSWSGGQLTKLRFGHYTASAFIAYSDGKRDIPLVASVGFWVIPWEFVAVAVLIVLLAAAGLWSVLSKFIRRTKVKGKREI